MKSTHLQQHEWDQGSLCQIKLPGHRKTSITFFHLFVESKKVDHIEAESRTEVNKG